MVGTKLLDDLKNSFIAATNCNPRLPTFSARFFFTFNCQRERPENTCSFRIKAMHMSMHCTIQYVCITSYTVCTVCRQRYSRAYTPTYATNLCKPWRALHIKTLFSQRFFANKEASVAPCANVKSVKCCITFYFAFAMYILYAPLKFYLSFYL